MSAEPARRVHVRAPGKLNVFFQVGEAGPDGYHDVASAYQAVSLFEDVVATPADGFTIEVHGDVDTSGVPRDDRNLAIRAARLVARELGLEVEAFRQLMEQRKIAVLCERGTDADAGLYRATFYFERRRARLIVDGDGHVHGPVEATDGE